MVTSREIRLKSHPVGLPTAESFELATVSVPAPGPREVHVKNLWMSVDPYIRGHMVARAGPAPAFPTRSVTNADWGRPPLTHPFR
jgi:NADPH-dependent curcumin reductase CurA